MPVNSNDPNITYFKKPSEFRKWLEKNYLEKEDLWVGFYKTSSGKKSITWPESVEQALCFGWIDGLRKSIDEESYKIRFTPRKKTSIWSNVNIALIKKLTDAGLMTAEGLKIFEERKEDKSGIYSFEQRKQAKLDPAYEKKFKANKKAWAWFKKSAAGYQTTVTWWIMRAKQEATKLKRLEILIRDSAKEQKIDQYKWNSKK
ncbi:MAG: YdeI/OmpD-associated family protein [Bacteroidia bacterium]